MTAIPARRRRRMMAAVISSVLTVIALPSGIVVGANSLLNESGGNKVDQGVVVDIPQTKVNLLAVVNANKELTAIALLAVAPGGNGGTIISVPVGAAADVAKGEAPSRLADGYAEGGLDALRFDVENLFNIALDFADDVTTAELVALLAPIGTQPVTMTQPIIGTDASNKPVVVIPAESTTVTGQQIADGLVATQKGIPESSRLAQVKALWSAVARAGVAAVPSDGSDASTSTSLPEMPDLPTTQSYFEALLRGEIDVWQFTATVLADAQRNPANIDLYSLDGGEILMVMASVLPGSLSLTSNGIAVMVDVPFGSTAIAREAVTRLAYMGANVVLVRQVNDLPVERTVAYYNDDLARGEAETFATLLGPLEYVSTIDVVTGVNLRIVLGNDFVAFLGNGATTSTTTTEPK
jgi:hypothetical protein